MNIAILTMALSASLNITPTNIKDTQNAVESQLISKAEVIQILAENQKANTMLDGLDIKLPTLFSSEELSLAAIKASDVVTQTNQSKRVVSNTSNSEE